MNKNSKLLLAFVGGLLLIAAGPLRPAFAGFIGTYIDTTTMVSVSTIAASPTQILQASNPLSGGDVGILVLWDNVGTKPNGEGIVLGSSNSGFSTSSSTGTGRIMAGNSESERFWLKDYSGPLYAVTFGTTTALTVSVIRKR